MEMGGVGSNAPYTPPGLCLSQHGFREFDWLCG